MNWGVYWVAFTIHGFELDDPFTFKQPSRGSLPQSGIAHAKDGPFDFNGL